MITYTLNNGVEIKNRLVVAPLTVYDAGPDGELTPASRKFWYDRFTYGDPQKFLENINDHMRLQSKIS